METRLVSYDQVIIKEYDWLNKSYWVTSKYFILLSAASSISGMVVWLLNIGQFENHYANWSMGLTVFAITLSVTAAILLIPDIRQYDYKDDLKVNGEFRNLSVTEAAKLKKKQPELEPVVEGEADLKPKIIPQNPLAAPSYQFMHYNKKKFQDGF